LSHILVTGGAGYIGSHAVRALHRAGHGVVVLDDLRAGERADLGGAPLVRVDAGDGGAVEKLLDQHGPFDAVMHFAAYLSVKESVEQPLLYYENNVAAARTLIQQAVRHGVRAFLLSSSAAVYGAPERQPIAEGVPLEPLNPYGASKAMVERMLADVEHAHGMRFAALRYFNASGADPEGGLGECHDPETHLIPLALEACAGLREAVVLYGTDYPTRDGTCIRDYIHVTDLAEAHVRAVEALLAGHRGGAYNLGAGRGFTNREVLTAVERVVGRPLPLQLGSRRPGDPAALVADPTRFCTEFGFETRHSELDTIVETAWAWLRERRQL
jgi:UDP-glucose-4-epimerase GalE